MKQFPESEKKAQFYLQQTIVKQKSLQNVKKKIQNVGEETMQTYSRRKIIYP